MLKKTNALFSPVFYITYCTENMTRVFLTVTFRPIHKRQKVPYPRTLNGTLFLPIIPSMELSTLVGESCIIARR